MEQQIKVIYEYTNDMFKAKKWLDSLSNVIACDFEVASKFTVKEKKLFEFRLGNSNLNREEKRILRQQLESDGLSYPFLTVITHFSIADANDKSYVIICDTNRIRQLVLNYLIETNRLQLWHNAQFDWKHIYYHTNKLPKNHIDTMLLARSLLNDANPLRCLVGLKDLMKYAYGEWAITKDEKKENAFTLEEMWNPKLIGYAAIDSAATFKLYEDLQEEINKWRI